MITGFREIKYGKQPTIKSNKYMKIINEKVRDIKDTYNTSIT